MKPIIIFDGACNFCNHYINRLISIDQKGIFLFTPYESDLSIKLVKKHKLSPDYRESFILFYKERYYVKSLAVIKILTELTFFWKVTAWAMRYLIPKSLKDVCYDYLAKKRYHISKKIDTCSTPTPKMRSRFRK